LGWHISQKRPRGLPYAEYREEPKRQTKKFCTVGLVELGQAWRAEAERQLAEMLEAQAKYDEFEALPLIVLPN
jgi:hypothetical protein